MDKLDIHNSKKLLEQLHSSVDKSDMSDKQKKLIDRFVLEARMGKNSKKRVGDKRIIINLQQFLNLHRYFKKDFDKLSEKDVENFQVDLDRDRFKQKTGKPYKKSSKDTMISSLKRYTKWIMSERKYKKTVGWLKEYNEPIDVPAITKEQAVKLADGSQYIRDKALTLFLFDSGCRIDEALQLKINQIEKKKKKNGEEFYIVDIKISKTLPRRISIPICSSVLTEWLKEHPDRENKDAYLFPVNYDAYRIALSRLSKRVLGLHITPHILRHSSATHYCKVINNPYKFVYRYGWTIGSGEAKRYIDRNLLGEEAQEELDNIIQGNKVGDLEKDIDKLKQTVTWLIDEWGEANKRARENAKDKHDITIEGIQYSLPEAEKKFSKRFPDLFNKKFPELKVR